MFEDFLIKYTWSAMGLMLASIPVFFPDLAGSTIKRKEALLAGKGADAATLASLQQGNRTQSFVTNKRLMLGLADAGGRLMLAGKDLSELAGYTHRVSELLKALQDLDLDKYEAPASEREILYDINNITAGSVEYGHEGIRFVSFLIF
jgi:ATP-binding cassette subfamily D (ALD) long-chain fatty acid import protein